MLINSISSANALKVRHLRSVGAVSCEDWDRLFPGASEGWGYFRACERAAADEFTLSALGVYAGETLIAAVPIFQIDYRLDTSLPSFIQSLTNVIQPYIPSLGRVPLLAMGSPYSEECVVGFDPQLCETMRCAAFGLLIEALRETAQSRGIRLTAIKDLPHEDNAWMGDILEQHKFGRFASLPVAQLNLPFETLDAYIKSLSPNMRKDLKRKINRSKAVTVEVCDTIDDIQDEVVELYRQTQANRKVDYEAFDVVPDSYFSHVMNGAKPFAKVMVYRVEGELAGFSLMLEEKDRVIGKFVGLNYALSRRHNVYFVNWLETVRYCLDRGIPMLQTGQTTYVLKTKMGCTLKPSWIYFNYASATLGPLFRFVGSHFGLDTVDPDLKQLGDAAPYVA